MAAKAKKFTVADAQALQRKLTGRIEDINGRLRSTQQKVEGVREWWKGGSEQGFIENFERTKTETETQLRKWLESYNQMMDKVIKVKQETQQELKRKLTNA